LSTLVRLDRNEDLRRQQKGGRNPDKQGSEQPGLGVVGRPIAGREDRQDEDQVDAAEPRHQPIRPGHEHRRADHEGREREQGKLVDPVQDHKLERARQSSRDRRPDERQSGKAFGSGVVAPNPITTTTSDSETSAAGQPARTKKAEGSARQAAARIPAAAAMRCDR
jgi:hypothetical protein